MLRADHGGAIWHRPFSLKDRLLDWLVSRHLQKRARRHLASGVRPMAVFAFDYIGHEIVQKGVFEQDELNVLFEFLKPMSGRFYLGDRPRHRCQCGEPRTFLRQTFRWGSRV